MDVWQGSFIPRKKCIKALTKALTKGTQKQGVSCVSISCLVMDHLIACYFDRALLKKGGSLPPVPTKRKESCNLMSPPSTILCRRERLIPQGRRCSDQLHGAWQWTDLSLSTPPEMHRVAFESVQGERPHHPRAATCVSSL